MDNVFGRFLSIIFFLTCGIGTLYAQPTEPFELKKPQKFENKKLGSEKTGEKKFTKPKRVLQNTITHYNWYYNANTKLNMVLERARLSHQDDYSKLLSFYNYSLDFTQSDSLELDSVVLKSTTGILIHDLRNDWTDNLFMLIGKAYYLQKDFDSAHRTFQYINYTWAPKEDNGYRRTIGSNDSEGGSVFQVATKESENIAKKVFSVPPSRNDALLWQIRTFISSGSYADAAGLIQILKKDPGFPDRLQPDLAELQALYFYSQQIYDSAAYYLTSALPVADTKEDKARWEFLIGQLYERSGKKEEARNYYEKVIEHTLNPVLEVYARLNAVKQHEGDSIAVEESLASLLKMGQRDRYSRYRDIIYYTAARIELDRNNVDKAKELLLKATRSVSQPGLLNSQRSNAFLLLGDLSFKTGEYQQAKSFYDSIPSGDPAITDLEAFSSRNEHLIQIIDNQQIIYRQDSLQRLAAMPEADREKFLNAELKRLKKIAGVEDEIPVNQNNRQERNAPPDLFGNKEKGDWYFHNANLKSKGFTSFKARWGTRENIDNWRRASAKPAFNRSGDLPQVQGDQLTINDPLSIAGLSRNIPLTIQQMEISNDSIEMAQVELGRIFLEGLEDYNMVITTLDSFPEQYPYSGRMAEALFYLYFSYRQLGLDVPAKQTLEELQEKFAGTSYEQQVTSAASGNPSDDPKSVMDRKYEEIYSLFIEGSFDSALSEKALADSLYGRNYWTPQLLYIESIYHIRQRDDAQAIEALQNIVSLFPESAMQEKASTLIEVLGRRSEIEEYLTNLEIDKQEDSLIIVDNTPTVLPQQKEITASAVKVAPVKNPALEKAKVETDKELGKLNQTKIIIPKIEPTDTLVVQTEPEKEKEVIVEKADSRPEIVRNKDSVQTQIIPKPDLAERVTATDKKESFGSYTNEPELPHFVVIVMNKVDPVYVTESRNAFNRYNQTAHSERTINIQNLSLNDTTKLVVMSGFEHSASALNYASATKEIASTAIIPWLPVGKYQFIVINAANLKILQESGNLKDYYEFQRRFFKIKL